MAVLDPVYLGSINEMLRLLNGNPQRTPMEDTIGIPKGCPVNGSAFGLRGFG